MNLTAFDEKEEKQTRLEVSIQQLSCWTGFNIVGVWSLCWGTRLKVWDAFTQRAALLWLWGRELSPSGCARNHEKLPNPEFPTQKLLPWRFFLSLLSALQSQQKCIVIFALVCCFAILVALIFSAVDIMGEDEDGLSEKNCQNKCR